MISIRTMQTGKFKYPQALLISFFIVISGFSQTRNLDFYIQEGLRNSPLLNDLKNQFNSINVDSLIIRAQKKPQIEGKSQLLYAPYHQNIGYDEVITDGGNYQAIGYVSQNILNRKTIENKFQALENQKQGISLNKKITEADLKKVITNLYLESYSLFSDLAFNRSFLALLKDQNQILGQFVKAGIFSQSDYLSLLVETEGEEVLINQLKNSYEKNIRLLNEACGLIDTLYVELSAPEIKLTSSGNLSDYLFLKQYTIDSLRILNERIALGLKYRPTVNWFADAGVLTHNLGNFYRYFGVSAGVSLIVPIYDGHQRKLEDQKLLIKENTRSFYNTISKKQYDQQYFRLKGELDGLKEVRNKLKTQLSVSDQLVKSLKSQLETGMVKMTDYIIALRIYRNINHNLNLTDIEIQSIINEMNYILTE